MNILLSGDCRYLGSNVLLCCVGARGRVDGKSPHTCVRLPPFCLASRRFGQTAQCWSNPSPTECNLSWHTHIAVEEVLTYPLYKQRQSQRGYEAAALA